MKIPARRVYVIISELINDLAVEIVKALKNRSNVSEFKLAEELGIEINIIRNHLYKLYNLNLVSFKRKKDQKKGWYIHYWSFNKTQVKFLIINYLKNKIDRIGDRLKRESNGQYFMCENVCVRFGFDQSTDFEFKCPECGELLNLQDNSKTIENLQNQLKEYERELKEVA